MAFELSPSQVQFLCSARGAEWLQKAEALPLNTASRLVDLQLLRRNLSPEFAAAVVEQVLLRRRGRQKFERADEMLFLRDALEQATNRRVAEHRGKRFAGLGRVADLGCGIGGDTLRLAEGVDFVWGFDLHPVRLAFAQHNASVYNLGHKIAFAQADILNLPAGLRRFDAFFADPARRTNRGKRTFDPRQYHPPLDKLMTTYAHCPLGIKAGPGLDFGFLPVGAEVELVSLGGEVKEAVLWFNAPRAPGVSRRATLLPGEYTLTDAAPDDCSVGELSAYLYEPDPAIIRAGLVKHLGAQLNLHLLDENIAYLSGDLAINSPFVNGYKIETRLPLKINEINHYLKTTPVSRINIKQRGTGLAPEAFAKKLKPAKTGLERTLILVRLQDSHLALACERL